MSNFFGIFWDFFGIFLGFFLGFFLAFGQFKKCLLNYFLSDYFGGGASFSMTLFLCCFGETTPLGESGWIFSGTRKWHADGVLECPNSLRGLRVLDFFSK